jgi:hypothetical protein
VLTQGSQDALSELMIDAYPAPIPQVWAIGIIVRGRGGVPATPWSGEVDICVLYVRS